MTTQVAETLLNPFPGLRPFREDEEYLFFGRENQIDKMVDRLGKTRFLAVVGTSGTGKSSLVNCGLKPALHRGLMTSAGSSWRMIQFRPGGNPIHSMAQAFANAEDFLGALEPGGLSLLQVAETTLRMSSLGVADLYGFARLEPGTNLLVVVDQFEELFRYGKATSSSPTNPDGLSGDAIAFVNLLLEPLSHPEYPIYIVLTMRSDFLGECSKFDGLPEVINESQYLVPRLARDERRAAIAGPVAVASGELDPVLLTRLVNDVGDNPDQLSIMQHAVNRTWAHWQNEGRGQGALSLEDYEAVGTMAHALDAHAEKAFHELAESRQRVLCEKVFKALTDTGTDARGIRRPMPFETLCAVADAKPEELMPVLAVFRKPSRSFLMPPLGETIEPDTMIDISHEILMRVWERLKRWAEEEAQSASTYRRLAESADLFAAGKEALLRNPALQIALDWKYRETPNSVWARMYRGGFDGALEFLETSKQTLDRERAEIEFQRRCRRLAPYLGLLMFVFFLSITPKISDWLRPSIRPRLERILRAHTKPVSHPAANQAAVPQSHPNEVAKLKAKAEQDISAANADVAPGLNNVIEGIGQGEFRNRMELAETIFNSIAYGVSGVISILLYVLLWFTGKRAYRRFAFPRILRKMGAQLPTPKPEPVRAAAAARKEGDAADAASLSELVIASVGKRFLAFLLDGVLLIGLGILSVGVVISTEGLLHIQSGSNAESVLIFALWLLADYLSQVLASVRLGGTLGNFICDMELRDKHGKRPRFGRISARYLLRGAPWLLSFPIIALAEPPRVDADTSSMILGFCVIFSLMISFAMLITIPFTKNRQTVYDLLTTVAFVRRSKKQKERIYRFDPAAA